MNERDIQENIHMLMRSTETQDKHHFDQAIQNLADFLGMNETDTKANIMMSLFSFFAKRGNQTMCEMALKCMANLYGVPKQMIHMYILQASEGVEPDHSMVEQIVEGQKC